MHGLAISKVDSYALKYLLISKQTSKAYGFTTLTMTLQWFTGKWGGGEVFDREFTKSLVIRDFDDVLKNPFRYAHLFLLHTLLSKKFPKIAMHDL